MSFAELLGELKRLITGLIDETKELREEIGILKLEIREMKQNMKPIDKKIDKNLIRKEITRIGKKPIETGGHYESGSMDDRFRKEILPMILEQEKEHEDQIKEEEEDRGKAKVEEENE